MTALYKIIQLDIKQDNRGQLVAIENRRDIPFDIKRIFYIFNIPQDAKRAQHANMKGQEIVLCLNGRCKMLLDDGKGQHVSLELYRKDEAVYVDPEVWIELSDFSDDCLLLGISDICYDKNNQLYDYHQFVSR